MKIKKTFNLYDLLCYINDNRKNFQDKIIQFISDSGHNFVVIDNDNISVNFSESHNMDLTMNNDLFTLEIDIDVRTHSFNYLNVFYREHLNPLYKKEVFTDCTIDDVLECFEKPLESYITIIFQNKVIYANGKVIDHE
uniref:Uncharacterized protein n=1 Tax=Staphylococcus phage vB_SauP_PSK TaxID=3240362 RepID=A0AB39U1N0_9CAUD